MTDLASIYPLQTFKDLPDPDDCYTFDNGCDLFGKEDREFDKIRHRYGDMYKDYHLILYRLKKSSPIMAKLWLEYSWESKYDGDLARWLSMLWACHIPASMVAAKKAVHIDSHVVDWRPTGSADPQVCLSFEVIGDWKTSRNALVSVATALDTTYKKMEKLYAKDPRSR